MIGKALSLLQEFYAGLEDRKYLPLGDAQKKSLQVSSSHRRPMTIAICLFDADGALYKDADFL